MPSIFFETSESFLDLDEANKLDEDSSIDKKQ